MIEVDGSFGEGGGQILRTSLALSLITGEPFRITRIRAGRKQPGMMRQHLTCVLAAARVGDAYCEGATIGSQELTFRPQSLRGGHYAFAIGTAGSTTLVLQTILVPLLLAPERSTIELEGGTHNMAAPSFDFLTRSFLPLLARMGATVDAKLERPGFYPAGGGRIVVTIEPAAQLARLELLDRGAIVSRSARAVVANLPYDIATREIAVVVEKTGWREHELQAHTMTGSIGPGNVLTIEVPHEHVTEVVTGFGKRGVRAEEVASRAVDEMQRYLDATGAVGEHLADQLLLPLAVGGGGAFTTNEPTLHTRTNADVIRMFGAADVRIEEEGGRWRIDVEKNSRV
ncbi:MAG TPA: RNA 3'-terminal phosphate cyclase [Thermoanaerobaculia bacterium]|jgi:RNA 3'-terminal phosphate cyclase (ATP)|nr:RNA 3'-terminal phosphate cyclase [Thermoanaerobaculia bacterium]